MVPPLFNSLTDEEKSALLVYFDNQEQKDIQSQRAPTWTQEIDKGLIMADGLHWITSDEWVDAREMQ